MAINYPDWPPVPGRPMKGVSSSAIRIDDTYPCLFSDGNEVALWNSLMYPGLWNLSNPNAGNQILRLDELIGGNLNDLQDLLCLHGHHLDDTNRNVRESQSRGVRHLQWAGKLLADQFNNGFKLGNYQWDCLQTNKPEMPLLFLEKLSLLHYLNEKELKPVEPVLRVTTWASVVHADLRSGSITLPFTIDLLPFECHSQTHPLHFPSPLNAFMMFTQEWLEGFDNACIAAWNEYQEITKSNSIDLSGLGFGIRWNLDLLPMWKEICEMNPTEFPIDTTFTHLHRLKETIPLDGQSVSAALGIATLKLLAEAHFLGAKRLGELAGEIEQKIK